MGLLTSLRRPHTYGRFQIDFAEELVVLQLFQAEFQDDVLRRQTSAEPSVSICTSPGPRQSGA
jgi:hypothetical protein